MMVKNGFIFFLLVHIFCDFYLQTQKMAENKKKSFRWLLYHIFLYTAGSMFLFFIFMPKLNIKYGLMFAGIHGIIDVAKYFIYTYCYDRKRKENEKAFFLTDQGIHILSILGIVYLIKDVSGLTLFRSSMISFFREFDLSGTGMLSWGIKLLLLHKPTNVLISLSLAPYRPQESDGYKDEKNMGRLIGTLERLIMMFFISISQYSAVGLVLTAKSIARYDRISKQQDFAEYYLLGTLLSTIGAIVISFLF